MADKITGVFAVDQENIQVGQTVATATNIAEMEECTAEVSTNVNNWTAFGNEGWESNYAYGKSLKITMKGKRCVGDAGNDFIASKYLANGNDAYGAVKLTNADGSTMSWEQAVFAVKSNGKNGKATDMAEFEVEVTPHGKPTITNPVTTTSTTTTTTGK